MPAMLRPGLAYCLTGGQAVFMDLTADRYFALSSAKTAAFSACLSEDPSPEVDTAMRYFMDAGILVAGVADATSAALPIIELPARDGPIQEDGSVRPRALMSAMTILLFTRFKQIYRPKALFALGLEARWWKFGGTSSGGVHLRDLLETMSCAERLLPLRLNCVSRTRALKHFLARYGLDTDMIVAVRLHPFSAHCWLQSGDMVLNDTLEGIAPYTVIRGIA
ncbi:lasso peptide biosynthesis B2 protein [Sphingobium cupriresistens]|uniref:lasso peptide biosynthesis B2 protein n=1 Tax=Sphingobium cupriresistens TaxID=1132417 RepID=UPI003BADC245